MFELDLPFQAPVNRHPQASLPSSLVAELDRIHRETTARRRIAVFDLDNTLLVGDIGDAVFAALLQKGYASEYRWEDYRRHLNSNKEQACRGVVAAMAGLSGRLIHKTTLDLLARRGEFVEVDHSFVPVPFAHPGMVQLVAFLRQSGYQVYVITASNEISARIVVWKMFGIPPFNVFGIRQQERHGTLTDEITEPVPIGHGKVEVYRKFIGEAAPLVTGGDSYLDIPMLQLASSKGLSVWVGEEKAAFDAARQRIGSERNCWFVRRPAGLRVDEQRPHRWEAADER